MTTPGWNIGATLMGIFVGIPFAYLVVEFLLIWAVLASMPW
jgi:hypothetical protein